jgi:hypothetical protein
MLAVLLAACAPAPPPPAKTAETLAQGTSAIFPQRPTKLFQAFQAYCSGPAHSFALTSPDHAECQEFLSPEPTAAIILRYDGRVDDLPKLVLVYEGRQTAQGYIVTNHAYLNVPRATGPDLRVLFDDPQIDKHVTGLLRTAGGTPIEPKLLR